MVDFVQHPAEIAGVWDGCRRVDLDQSELGCKFPGPEVRTVKALPGSRSPAEHLKIFCDGIVRGCLIGQANMGVDEVVYVAEDHGRALLSRLFDVDAKSR